MKARNRIATTLAAGLLIAFISSPAHGQGCNQPPDPVPGETVTWTAEGGPYELCEDVAIPADATVIVEAGAVIDIPTGRFIRVRGAFLLEGADGNPVTLTGNRFQQPPLEVRGRVDVRYADIALRVGAFSGARMSVADTSMTGQIDATGTVIGEPNPFLSFDRCEIIEGNIYVQHGTLAIRDTALADRSVTINNGYLFADGLVVDAGQLSLRRDRGSQPAYLNDLSVTNFGGPGLELIGWDFFLGPDNVLENNLFPVRALGGLLTGSTVPTSGNTNNVVDGGDGGLIGPAQLGAIAVPYRIDGVTGTGAELTIDPGVVMEFTGGSVLNPERFRAYGRPEAPITFRGVSPGVIWDGIRFQSSTTGPALKHCIVEGSRLGVAPADTPGASVESCVFRNNERGVNASTFAVLNVHKCRFIDNRVGARETATGSVVLDDAANPNAFEGNDLAVDGIEAGTVHAAHCWWGDPSGPRHPSNPDGTGDPVTNNVEFVPFLTSPPDFDDHPPIVRMMKPSALMETGAKAFITWTAEDDGSIVSQRILFSEHGNHDYVVLADDLAPSQRSYELTVPVALPSSNNSLTFIRVVAVDDIGQEGFDEHDFFVPYLEDVSGSLTSAEYKGPYTIGEHSDVCWEVGGGSGIITAWLLADGDDVRVTLGGAHTGVECLSLGVWMPYASTDTARVQLALNLGAGGRDAYFFSNEFTIRPDVLLGDEPPVISVAPGAPGAASACGVTIPIEWTASDDEALRSFDVQASYDGRRTWHFIARELPADARSYDWHVDPVEGIPDVRVRVIARDLRFQTTSHGGDVSFSIPPGSGEPPVGDVDGNCVVDFADLLALLSAWGPCQGPCPADFNDDGVVDFDDLLLLLAFWT